jgi:hypothetical protein
VSITIFLSRALFAYPHRQAMKVVSLAYPVRLLVAVLAYLTLYVVGSNVAWLLRVRRPGRLGQVVDLARRWDSKLSLGQLLRLAYYLLGPYLILSWGWASPLDLGLANLDWVGGMGATVALGAGCLLLLGWQWWQHARLSEGPVTLEQVQWLEQPWGWSFLLREAVYLETWWALCRSPMLVLAGPYWGVYLGLAAVFVAALLNPRVRHALRTPGYREEVILTGSLAMVTATLYVFTHNLWLCIMLHLVLQVAILDLVRRENRLRPSD